MQGKDRDTPTSTTQTLSACLFGLHQASLTNSGRPRAAGKLGPIFFHCHTVLVTEESLVGGHE